MLFSTLTLFFCIQVYQLSAFVSLYLVVILFFLNSRMAKTARSRDGKPWEFESASKTGKTQYGLLLASMMTLFCAMLSFFTRITARVTEEVVSEIINSLFIQIPLFLSLLLLELEGFFFFGKKNVKDAKPRPPNYPPLSPD
ncbi:MAG: hypothetical protein GY859_11135 [Desulfobacterales bacterium]|nr:hypothetical protein [Desulfobacterales bacterium]